MRSRLSRPIVLGLLLAGAATILPAGDNMWTPNGPDGGTFGWFKFHPQKNKLVFAGGWFNGFFRSLDGGTTWRRAEVLDKIVGLRIHPRDSGKMIAFANSVYASADEGRSWQQIASRPLGPGDFTDVEFHPISPQTLYAVFSVDPQTGGVYKSTDGGKTWTRKSAGIDFGCTEALYCSSPHLEIDPANGNIVYALLPSLKVFKTVDGGESWVNASAGLDLSGAPAVRSLVIDPANPQVLYVVGQFEIFKTTDGAAHWSAYSQKGGWAISVDARHPQNVYLAGGGGVWKSRDGGQDWADVSPDEFGFWGVSVHPRSSSTVFAGADAGGIFRSRNQGQTWKRVNTGLDALSVTQMRRDPQEPDHLLAVMGSKFLMQSRDGGETWALSALDVGAQANWLDFVEFHPKNSKLLAAGGAPELSISTDGGETWEVRSLIGDQGMCVAFDGRNQNVLYEAPWIGRGQIGLGMAKSTDQGRTWELINTGLSDKEVSSIVVDPKNSQTVFAGTSNGSVFKSTNGGASWKKSSLGSGAGWVSRITVDAADSKIVYAATMGGTFKSVDGAATWKPLNPDRGGFFVEMDRTNPRTLYTGGWGGIFLSTDRGDTWSAFDSTGLGPFPISELLLDPEDPNHFLVGTERGIFSYTRKVAPGAPTIQQVSPASGKTGDAVMINGSGFGSAQGTSKVLFGSVDAGSAQSWSDASITTSVPAAAANNAVTVTVSDKRSNPFEFTVLPASGNVWPTSGPAAGGTRVTILAPDGLSGNTFSVLFGAALATDVRFTAPDIITCNAPPGSGSVDVKVTTVLTWATRGTFTYQ